MSTQITLWILLLQFLSLLFPHESLNLGSNIIIPQAQDAKTYPHDDQCFTQGFKLIDNSTVVESCGLYRRSSIRKWNLQTGALIQHQSLPPHYFAEGLEVVQDKILLLTWRNQILLWHDLKTLKPLKHYPFPYEGYGLAYNSQDNVLYATNSTHVINTFKVDSTAMTLEFISSFPVLDKEGSPIPLINELEYISPYIFGNVWMTSYVLVIDPLDGSLVYTLDLSSFEDRYLRPSSTADRIERGERVANGVAINPFSDFRRLLITGKLWDRVYEITLPEALVLHMNTVRIARGLPTRDVTAHNASSAIPSTANAHGELLDPAEGDRDAPLEIPPLGGLPVLSASPGLEELPKTESLPEESEEPGMNLSTPSSTLPLEPPASDLASNLSMTAEDLPPLASEEQANPLPPPVVETPVSSISTKSATPLSQASDNLSSASTTPLESPGFSRSESLHDSDAINGNWILGEGEKALETLTEAGEIQDSPLTTTTLQRDKEETQEHFQDQNFFQNIQWIDLANLCAAIYVVCWGVSFYPQIWINYKSKSTKSLSYDLTILNVISFLLYSTYVVTSYLVQEHYHYPRAFRQSDIVFAGHSLICSCIIFYQTKIYSSRSIGEADRNVIERATVEERTGLERRSIIGEKEEKLSKGTKTLVYSILIILIVELVLVFQNKLLWIDINPDTKYSLWTFISSLGFIKSFLTMTKYIPQVIYIYRNKSTNGLSTMMFTTDAIGGVTSIAENFFVALHTHQYHVITHNIPKMVTGSFSLMYDLIILWQIWYFSRRGEKAALVGVMENVGNKHVKYQIINSAVGGEEKKKTHAAIDESIHCNVIVSGGNSRKKGRKSGMQRNRHSYTYKGNRLEESFSDLSSTYSIENEGKMKEGRRESNASSYMI